MKNRLFKAILFFLLVLFAIQTSFLGADENGNNYKDGEIILKFMSQEELEIEQEILISQGLEELAALIHPELAMNVQEAVHGSESLLLTAGEILQIEELPEILAAFIADDTVMEPVFKGRHRTMRRDGLTDEEYDPDLPMVFYFSHVYIFRNIASNGESMEEIGSRLGQEIHIKHAYPNYEIWAMGDTYWGSSGAWGQSYEDLWGLYKIQADDAWYESKGSGVVVAVLDTGIDYTHPDITANMWINGPENIPFYGGDEDGNTYIDDIYGYDFVNEDGDPFDLHGHGTHVAGTIAAVGNNGIGVIGVAPKAKVMALQILDCFGGGYVEDALDAIDYAIHMKAARTNNALFYPVNPGDEDKSWQRFHDEALDRFVVGQYAGDYEAALIEEFDAYLPDTPPWKK